MRAVRPPTEPNTIVLVISGRIARADIARLSHRLGMLLEGCDAGLVVCDVSALVDPDCVMVDALARLQLIAGRLGRQVRFRQGCGELQDLLALMGLRDVLLPCSGLSLQPGRESEEREQPRGVEEEADPGDLAG